MRGHGGPRKQPINYTEGFFDSLGWNHVSQVNVWKSDRGFFEVSEIEDIAETVTIAAGWGGVSFPEKTKGSIIR